MRYSYFDFVISLEGFYAFSLVYLACGICGKKGFWGAGGV